MQNRTSVLRLILHLRSLSIAVTVLTLALSCFGSGTPGTLCASEFTSNNQGDRGGNVVEQGLQAGVFAINIDPIDFPVIVNGGMYERTADKVLESLHARCFVFQSSDKKLAICVVDSCMIPRDILDQAKQLASKSTGIPVNHILISSTHTHSAPSSFGALGSDADPRYIRFLIPQLAKGIKLAHDRLQPAQIGWGIGQDKNNVFNRRWLMKEGTAATNRFSGKQNDRAQMNPGVGNKNKIKQLGTVDPDVFVVSIQTRQGKPLGVLANYSTHYAGAPSLSADYFGIFANILRQEYADGSKEFMAAMSNGTSGDTNCIDFTDAQRKFDRFSVARDSANVTLKVLKQIKYASDVTLDMVQTELELGIRQAGPDELMEAEKVVASLNGKKPRTLEQVYAREAVLLSKLPPRRKIVLQSIRIGDLAIATFPNEVFTETGLKIKKNSPFQSTFNIELANGADGYIAPPAHHQLGGYTTWRARSSCLEVNAEPKIVNRLLEMLKKLADRKQ